MKLLKVLIILFAYQNVMAATGPIPFTAHEWGTFTSLQGSDGSVTAGMHHEDEVLPEFVHGRDPMKEFRVNQLTVSPPRRCPEPKCFESLANREPLSVTQKMETPVLYFYSDEPAKDVKVEVGFPHGVISEYYPAPTSFLPAIGNIGNRLQGGKVEFDIRIHDNQTPVPSLPEVPADNIYSPSRNVNSRYITNTKGESERFIFYRGLGQFATDLRVTSDISKGLSITTGKFATGKLFLINKTPNGGSYLLLESLNVNSEVKVTPEMLKKLQTLRSNEVFVRTISKELTQALTDTGLFLGESIAMVKTWEKSYFQANGLRLLYILSRAETEKIIPLKITPQPAEVVRTLVGRIEVMQAQEEQDLLAKLDLASQGRGDFNVNELGRFAEPKLRRVQLLSTSQATKNYISNLITQLQ